MSNNTTNMLTQMMQTAVVEFEELLANNYDDASWEGSVAVNSYITKYEGVFLTIGQWVRLVYVKFGDPTAKPHQKISGVLGVISMNIEILKKRIIFTQM
jgi:hypothetical protein